jgi:hypothetical protein
MREQFQATKQQEGAATNWARKFDEAVEALVKISPNSITTGPSKFIEAYASSRREHTDFARALKLL